MNDLGSSFCVGAKAPDFKMKGAVNSGEIKEYSLADFRGHWVVLFFYPLDFSIVCPTEVREFSQRFDEFILNESLVFGISTDPIESHVKWINEIGDIRYPLLSDATLDASKAYQTLAPGVEVALRGTFIIDPHGVLRYALYHDNAVGRSVSETLRVLAALRTGEMCPAEWQPGEQTLGLFQPI